MKRRVSITKLLALALATIVVACSESDLIESRAKHFVRRTYNDVDRIIMVDIKPVTIGDNLDYRIERAAINKGYAESSLKTAILSAEELKRYGYDYTSSVEEARARLAEETAWCAALDSLKASLGEELNLVTAYNCAVAYNYPNNLVWVQIDKYGNLLKITKDARERLLNPGNDAPGYFELWKKHYGR